MANPRIYFKIDSSNGVLIPTINQSRDLYNKLTMPSIIKRNAANYNEYTKEFIADHDSTGETFWSEDYDWDPKKFVFNFRKINKNTEEDWVLMMSEPCNFDMKKEYLSATTKMETGRGLSLLDEIKRKTPCPDVSSGFYFDEIKWNILVRNIKKHQNTMLTGPTGAGKTDVIMRICKALGIPCRVYDMGAMMDPLSDLLGTHRLENGSSKFDYAKFVEDVQTPGVILLDEISRAPLMTNNILFPCLDCRRELPLDIADSKCERRVKINPDVTFIATANIGSEYSGTNEIDAALANRFMTIQVNYLPSNIEENILTIRTGIDGDSAKRIVAVANALREKYFENLISKPISTRETIACAEMVADGFTLLDSIKYGICEKYSKFGRDNEYDSVKTIIMGF